MYERDLSVINITRLRYWKAIGDSTVRRIRGARRESRVTWPRVRHVSILPGIARF